MGTGQRSAFDAAKPDRPEQPKKGLWKVQVGAYAQKDNALAMEQRLKRDGYPTYVVFEEE